MRTTFINCLIEQAAHDERIYVLTPDMGFSVFEKFREKYPDRFLNVGIAEQNAIGVAAGLALSGKLVYVYSIIPFVTMRCFEQVRVDLAYMNTNVRIVGVGAGLSYGPAGATHHAIEDIAIMRALPNMTVCCPGDPVEVKGLVQESFKHDGPMYIRLGKSGEPIIHSTNTSVRIGKAVVVTEGKDLALLTTSNMLETGYKWALASRKMDIHMKLISMPTVKPMDVSVIHQLIDEGIPMITLEEHNIIGGLGSAVAEVIAEYGKPVKFKRLGINDAFCHHVGGQTFLRKKLGLADIGDVLSIIS